MAADLYLSFGADTGPLEEAFALAKAEANATAREMAALAKQMQATGASADSDLGRHLSAVASGLAEAKGRVAEASAALKEHAQSVNEAGGALGRLTESIKAPFEQIEALKGSLTGVAEVAGAAFAFDAVKEWVVSTAEAAENIERLGAKLGASTDEIQELGAVAKLTGSDFDQITLQLERLQLGLAKTSSEASPARAALAAVGIEADKFRRLPIPQQLEAMAEAFSRFADGPNKTAVAMAVLGRAGAEMIPLLDRGPEVLRELAETAERAGAVMSQETVEALAKTSERIKELGLEWTGLSNTIYSALQGPINGAIAIITDLTSSIRQSIAEEGFWADALTAVGWIIKQTEQFIGETVWIIKNLAAAADDMQAKLGQAFVTVGTVASDVFKALSDGIPAFFTALVTAAREAVLIVGKEFVDLGTAISDGLHGDVAGAKAAFASMADDAKASLDKMSGAFHGVFDLSKAQDDYKSGLAAIKGLNDKFNSDIEENARHAKAVYDSIWGIGPAGDPRGGEGAGQGAISPNKPQVAALQLGKGGGKSGGASDTGDSGEQAEDQWRRAVEAARAGEQQIQAILDTGLKTKQLTESQWLEATIAELEGEKAAIQQAAQQALASAALTSAQRLDIMQEEQRKLDEIAEAEAKAQEKAAADAAKAWDDFFKPLNSAVESQIGGLISGSEKWGAAVKKTLDQLTADLLKFFTTWALKQAETVAAHLAGNQIMEASDQASSLAALGEMVAGAARMIAIDAGVVAGGVAANQAFILGPGAVAEGLGAAATVAGFGGGIGSADIGMWDVPHDMLTLIHHNELVMPAAQAGAFRDLISGQAAGQGGPSVAIHPTTNIYASGIDQASMRQFWRQSGPDVLRSVDEAVRHGASLGLKRLR
jgi:hypothetical protein